MAKTEAERVRMANHQAMDSITRFLEAWYTQTPGELVRARGWEVLPGGTSRNSVARTRDDGLRHG